MFLFLFSSASLLYFSCHVHFLKFIYVCVCVCFINIYSELCELKTDTTAEKTIFMVNLFSKTDSGIKVVAVHVKIQR